MTAPPVPLSGKKKNALHKAVAQPPLSPNFAATGATHPNRRVFVANFDGTQNDFKDVPKELQETLVAASFNSLSDSPVLVNRYYNGVGTRTDGFLGLVESVSGIGCVDRAERAYQELCDATLAWRATNPEADVHVHAVGFSRGSATALHFMNLVHERGIVNPKTFWARNPKTPQSARVAPGAVQMSAVLLDTVATGQNDSLKLGLPPGAVSVLHLTAGGELRFLFPLTSIADPGRPNELAEAIGASMPGAEAEVPAPGADAKQPVTYRRLHQVMLQGACHSDVGGSYRDGHIREVSGYLMKAFQLSLGLPVGANPRPSFAHIQDAYAHDSRYIIDKLAPQRPYYRGTRRIVENAPVNDWDGTLTELVTVESRFKGVKQESSNLRRVEPVAGDADEAEARGLVQWPAAYPAEVLGKEHKLTVRLADATKGEKGRMVFESTPPGAFGRQSGSRRFMFLGRPLMAAPTADAIIGRLEAGEKKFQLTVRVEKALPVVQVEPGFGFAVAEERRNAPDSWTPEIRAAILRVNSQPKSFTQHDVDAMMRSCLRSVAVKLQTEHLASIKKEPRQPGRISQYRAMVHFGPAPGSADAPFKSPHMASTLVVTFDAANTYAPGHEVGELDRMVDVCISCHEKGSMHDGCPAIGQSVAELRAGLTCLADLIERRGLDARTLCNHYAPPTVELPSAASVNVASLFRSDDAPNGSLDYDDESLWSRMRDAAETARASSTPINMDQLTPEMVAPMLRPSVMMAALASETPAPTVSEPAKLASRRRM
jgi:hypothetical protein